MTNFLTAFSRLLNRAKVRAFCATIGLAAVAGVCPGDILPDAIFHPWPPLNEFPTLEDPGPWDGSDDCGGSPGGGHPVSGDPVNLYWLSKMDSVDDLRVQLPGNDFVLRRQFNSRFMFGWRKHLGPTWFLANQPYLDFKEYDETAYIRLVLDAKGESRWVSQDPADLLERFRIIGGGPSNQQILRSYVQRYDPHPDVEGEATLSTFALVRPGVGVKHFYKPVALPTSGSPTGLVPPDDAAFTLVDQNLFGMLLREVDNHGNIQDYDYEWTTSTVSGPRPSAVRCISADGNLAAVITFDWIYTIPETQEVCAAPSMLHGKLRRVKVLRPAAPCSSPIGAECDLVETDRVEYTYFDDLFPSDDTYPCNVVPADPNWLGRPGDLVQVAKYSRVDAYGPDGQAEGDPATSVGWHETVPYPHVARFTQYRYYAGLTGGLVDYGKCNDCPEDLYPLGTEDYGGTEGQIRMVIHPEQVEFYAEDANSADRQSVFDRAFELMLTDDDLVGSLDRVERVRDLAAKMVVYSKRSAINVVYRQYLSSAGCGCGTSANHLSKRLTYTMVPDPDSANMARDWDDFQGAAPGEGRYAVSVRVQEHLATGPASYGADSYRTQFYDLGAWDTPVHGTLNVLRRLTITPYLINHVIADHDLDWRARFDNPGNYTGTKVWATHYAYDDDTRQLKRIATSAASDRDSPYRQARFEAPYGSTNPDFGHNLPNWFAASPTSPGGDGLVHMYVYDSNKMLVERRVRSGWGSVTPDRDDDFSIGEPDSSGLLLERYSYVPISASPFSFYLPSKVERFRDHTDTATPSKIETVEYAYGFRNETTFLTDLAWVKTTVEAETQAENGTTGATENTYSTVTLLDRNGTPTFVKQADGSVQAMYSHGQTGLTSREEYNSEIPSLFFALDFDLATIPGWSGMPSERTSDGGALVRQLIRNLRGDLIRVVETNGEETLLTREARGEYGASSDVSRLAVVTLPQAADSSTTPTTYSGPAVVEFRTAAGQPTLRQEHAIGSGGITKVTGTQTGWHRSVSAYDLGDTLAKSLSAYLPSGVLEKETVWHDVSGDTLLDHTLVTHYRHDALGRLVKIREPNGALREYQYDVRDRVVAEFVGVGDHTSPTFGGFVTVDAPTLVTERYFDGDTSSLTIFGGGNGTLTSTVEHESSSVSRTTRRFFDWRDRPVAVLRPENPAEFTGYDNLNRPIAMALVPVDMSSDPAGQVETLLTTAPWDNATLSERKLFERRNYSQRGLMYRREFASDPTNLASGYLQWDWWPDELGRAVAEAAPAQPMTKTRFDGLGRPTVVFTTDGAGGPTPGGGFAIADFRASGASAAVASDRVVEETRVTHHAGGAESLLDGEVEFIDVYRRTHNADADSVTPGIQDVFGALLSASPSSSVRSSIGYLYDDSARAIQTIDFGTNNLSFNVFATGGATLDPASPDGDALITVTAYDERGLVKTVEDPEGKKIRMFYDDLPRQVAIVENWVDADVVRDSTDPWKWTLDLGTQSGLDEDRATLSYHDLANNKSYLVAAHSAGDASTPSSTSVAEQVTVYTYRVRTSDAVLGTVASLLNSNDLLSEVAYPDSAGTGDVVSYRYNILGELTALQDQNGTVHTYDRDALGRVTSDRVAALGSNINGAIRRIELEYDSAGRRSVVRSFDAPTGGDVRNAVGFEYSPLWQVSAVRQNPLGDLGGDHELVTAYAYDTDSGDNYSRLDELAYPSNPSGGVRTTLAMEYGGLDGLNDAIHRVRGFSWDFGTTSRSLSQEYVGLSLIVRKDLNLIAGSTVSPLVRHDRFVDPATGDGASGSYAALDRFGRVKGQLWVWPDATSTEWDADVRPAIVDLRYTYDMSSNVLDRLDRRASGRVGITGPDERYSYDGLDRLAKAERGKRTDSTGNWGDWAPGGQQWTLDPVGNWLQTITDTTGDGAFTANTDFTDRRNSNPVNEISGGSAYDQQVQSGMLSATDLDYTYDDAGNMTGREKLVGSSASGWTYVYDAWNRLVTVKDGGSGGGDVRVHYAYNGLHQRAARIATSDPTLGYVDEANLYYYDAGWRLLEEHIDSAAFTALMQPAESDPFAVIAPDTAPVFVADVMVQRVWGLEYIDELLFVMEDRDDEPEPPASASGFPDGDFTSPNKGTNYVRGYHAVVDRLYSVVALLDDQGDVLERVRYNSYGHARQQWVFIGDVNGDGRFDSTDGTLFLGAYPSEIGLDAHYNADADINGDGIVLIDDLLHANSNLAAAPDGQISQYANTVGYAGYLFDPATEMCLARFRWYDPEQGRWASRDPITYFAGMSMQEYVASAPTLFFDPFGLHKQDRWYDIPLKNYKPFRDFVHDAKNKDGIPGKKQYTKDQLQDMLEDFFREGDHKGLPKNLRERSMRYLRNNGRFFGLVLGVVSLYGLTSDISDAFASGPCNNLLSAVAEAEQRGFCNRDHLEETATKCQFEMMDKFGGAGLGMGIVPTWNWFEEMKENIRDGCDDLDRKRNKDIVSGSCAP